MVIGSQGLVERERPDKPKESTRVRLVNGVADRSGQGWKRLPVALRYLLLSSALTAMANRYSAADLEVLNAVERAEVVKAAVVTDSDQIDQRLLERGRKRLADRFAELAN